MKITKLTSLVLAATVLITPVLAAEQKTVFDFERDDGGFTPIYADYPAGDGVEDFYELKHGHEEVPIDGAGKGLFLSGNNHSDDLFMGWYKELTGLEPGQLYIFRVSFRLATNVDGGLVGVGGSPGASVYVKGGVTMERPEARLDGLGYYRLNVDKGNQGQAGIDLANLGNLEKEETLRPGEYEWKEFSFEAQAKADAAGRVWLVLGTDSGFEATSSYYLDDISLTWTEASDEVITRSAAIQRMYDDLRPAGSDTPDFADVGEGSLYWDALGWAQKVGLVSGYGNGMFGGNDPLTVEQGITILYRYAGSPEAETEGVPSVQVADWARSAVIWGIKNGLISEKGGTGGGKLMGTFTFTRAWGKLRLAGVADGPVF